MASQSEAWVGCFALLDDCGATPGDPRSRLYTACVGVLPCAHAGHLPDLLEQMRQAWRHGWHAVGVFSYELGAALHGIAPHAQDPALTRILLFQHCERLSAGDVARWLDRQEQAASHDAGNASSTPAGVADLRANVDEPTFCDAMARIHAYIEAGDAYQINYTYRLHFDAFGSPFALYRRLRERQRVPYGALIRLPDDQVILSLSPELFVRHTAGQLRAQPMKGTAAATGDAAQDEARATALAADSKNCAENLMIVDLLRNDLGRVAQIGSVHVPRLFEVSRYGSVLQMTSTVTARAREDATLAEVFQALYPCGSITGAPKRRAMQIIRELESAPRGFYTGAIGWFDPPPAEQPLGDFCLSVPIRTLVLQAPDTRGVRPGVLGIGAGIVHDSQAAEEYAECRLKARFLSTLAQEFELFETMHATQAGGCRHVERHLQRLGASALYFGFVYDEQAIRQRLRDACAALPPATAYRLRLALRPSGACDVQCAPLQAQQLPVRVLLASAPTRADELFLRHKTTVRDRYDAAWRGAEARGAFDMLFFNTEGELTEGARSNVFVKLDDQWHTPPLACGLLPGVMRAVLLDDPAWHATERRLTRDDLRAAQEVVLCNALRGVLPAIVDWN